MPLTETIAHASSAARSCTLCGGDRAVRLFAKAGFLTIDYAAAQLPA